MKRNRGFNYQRMLWELRPDLVPKLARPVVTCSDAPQEFETPLCDLDFPDDDRDEVEAA